jgi:PIF1-like helicase
MKFTWNSKIENLESPKEQTDDHW